NKQQIATAVNQGKVVILNVHGGRHWVLATGVSGQTFRVNDPGANVAAYPFSGVVKAGILTKGAKLSAEAVEYYDFEDEDVEAIDEPFEFDEDMYVFDFDNYTGEVENFDGLFQ